MYYRKVLTNTAIKVFNSALMIYGSLLVNSKHGGRSAPSDQVEACRHLLTRAVQVLRSLDEGNVTVERCALFIEELAHQLDNTYRPAPEIKRHKTMSMEEMTGAVKGTDSSRTARFLSPHRRSAQENSSNTMVHNEQSGGTGFLFEHGYADEFELSQFFLGGGMEPWINDQG